MAENPFNLDDEALKKGKPPRKVLIIIGVMVAIVVAALGFYSQTKDANEAARKKEAARDAKLAETTAASPTETDVDSIIRQQQGDALTQERKQQAQARTPVTAINDEPKLTADGFVREEAANRGQASSGGKEDDIYSAPIFKKGREGEGGGAAAAAAGVAATLTPGAMALAQKQAGQDAVDNASAQAAAMAAKLAQSGQSTSANHPSGKSDDSKFLADTATLSKSGAGFKTSTFVGQERGCTLAPPHHIDVLTMEGGNSDRPGTIALMVNEDVYDSVHGDCLMIPRGTTITAPYSSDIAPGQESLLVAATEMRLPNGKQVPLDGAPGADPNGYNGFSAHVNNHFLRIFGVSFLTAVLVNKFDGSSTTSTTTGAYGVQQVGSTAGQVAGQTAQSVLQRYQNMQPTLTVKPGQHFMLKVTHDLVLEPYHYE